MASTEVPSEGKEDDSYCLHNSDHPGMSLVNTPLDGRNYFAWSIAIRTALEAKDKVGFIDGSLPAPENSTEFKRWKTVDSMIKSWMVNSLTKELADTSVCCLSSKNLWDTLDERVNPMPTCTYGKCTCELNKKITTLLASMKLLQFLMGLNPVYDVVRTQILNLDPLPAINKAYNMVITDEAQREFKELREKRAGKKTVAANVKDSGNTEASATQNNDSGSNTDLANAVSYLLKEVQRLGKGKTTATKDEQEQRTRHILAKGRVIDSLYYLDKEAFSSCNKRQCLKCNKKANVLLNNAADMNKEIDSSSPTVLFNSTTEKTSEEIQMWHNRMGHPSTRTLKHIDQLKLTSISEHCEICHKAKQHRLSFQISDSRAQTRMPTSLLGWKSPYEVLQQQKPDYRKLRTFGCLCYSTNTTPHKDKFESRAYKCIFLGYPNGQKSYKLYDMDNKKIVISRDVIFYENIFPFQSGMEGKEVPLPQFFVNADECEAEIVDPLEEQQESQDETYTEEVPNEWQQKMEILNQKMNCSNMNLNQLALEQE
ncbi:putative reverse transcriptase, RNA-dependent DNA polymerase, Gag-polypeptide of LTR copia-type [Senna tora]|uniref:Putative reverse transcriptase, RNA-dependent DNA polymerase, Gag-polypeptide of LTR copia-type n=1 Tax=Senna tora TaxID=362788 RepID=A0A834X7A1_9FABA|nr:putative reverse transcriptase, RNA-dependent DNA polymerase, Gag-polypeptide of LTR copia-type [Senna tora]